MRTTLRLRGELLILLLGALLLAGCSSSSDKNPTGNNTGSSLGPNLSSVGIQTPTPMQTAATADPTGGAATGVGHLATLNGFKSYASWWTRPTARAAAALDTIISWQDGSLSILVQISDAGSVYTWSVILNGSKGGKTYSDFLFIDGFQELGGDIGQMQVYDAATPGSVLEFWTWSKTPEGALNMNYHNLQTDESIFGLGNPDGSGSVSHNVGAGLTFGANWAADGSGNYTIFDGGGGVLSSGTW